MIKEIRDKYPEYNDMSDKQLADALHRKHYSDMNRDDFYSKIGLQTEPVEQHSGLLEKLGQRNERVEALQQQRRSGEITRPEEIYRSAGEGAGAVLDVAGAGMSLLDKAAFNLPSKAASSALKLAGKLPTGFGGEGTLAESLPQEMQNMAGAYSEFKEENPRKAGLIEATGNLLSLGSTPLTKKGFQKAGKEIYESGVKKSDKTLLKKIQPEYTPKVRTEAQRAGRLKEGYEDFILPSKSEQRALDVIKKENVFGKKMPKSDYKKERLIRQKAIDISKDMQKDLGQFNYLKLKPDPLKKTLLNRIETDLLDDPTIWTSGGDYKATVRNYVQKINDIIDSNPNTLQGLMKSRIEFDDWVRSKTPNIFNPGAETVNRAATRAVRNSVNDIVDKALPNGAVRKRLSDSSALFDAADNLSDKIGKLPNTVINRAIKDVEDALPFKSEGMKAGAATGAGIAAYQNPKAATLLALLYAVPKAANSAQSRKLIGTILKEGDGVFDLATKDALQNYMNQLEDQEEEALKSDVKTGKMFFEGQQ